MEFMELIKTPKVDNVVFVRSFNRKKVTGTLCLTSHHLLFVDRSSISPEEELMILYTSIECLEKKVSGIAGDVTLRLKDFTLLKFKIPSQEDALNVADSVEKLSSLGSATSYYPFFLNVEILDDGWERFRMQEEYNKIIGASTDWRISSVNQDYKVCRSYPSLVIVPSNCTDDMLRASAGFRQIQRFPILAYLHTNKIPILRSSQPLTGSGGRRCKDDEKLLSVIATGHKGTIVDTRSSMVVSSNKSKKGGGIETDYYTHWRRTMHNIEKATHLADTIARLYEACSDTKAPNWLSKLEASGWMRYIESCLTAALKVAVYVCKDNSPVLVHGENGQDMTLVVTSLAQVLLDPSSRTVLGFESLIMRDWIWAGYPFTKRHQRVGFATNKRKENSATFLLFLDCVHQIMNQYGSTFEFNENFLLVLFEHSYYSQYGTFLFDCELQREQSKLRQKTTSLWSYLNDEGVLAKYRNPLYEHNEQVLWPSVAPQSMQLWYSMFAKSTLSRGPDSKNELDIVITETKKENEELKIKARMLKERYEELLKQQA
ncbi:myotubularin-related protein 9-like [Clytia hemisphaerica]|uniref:Myotubularin phosphatase domain-containing protein n=1 Tax=Clytia hemisphaerica TaxID=252671 RepID=A0A7M5UVY6_9CNID